MKVFKILAAVAALATMSWGQCAEGTTLWATGGSTQTLYGGSGGYWYGFTDAAESGTSSWSCGASGPVAEGAEFPAECIATGPIVADFSITSDATDGTYTWGYAAIAFDIIDNGLGPKSGGDLSCASGVIVDYSATSAVYLKLTSNAQSTNPAQYQYKLPSGGSTVTVLWTDLAQPSWAAGAQVFAFDPGDVEAVQFQAHSENGTGASSLTINSIKLTGTGGTIAVLDRMEGNSFSVNFSSQGLRFAGLREMGKMNVELYNLQGQLVAAQEVSAARSFLNTSSLTNGLYVVKASNADYSFTRQVQMIR